MSSAQAATYDYRVTRWFAIMAVVYGIVGMLVGVIVAAQLAFPELNFGVPWLSFGRLRPLHTNAVISHLVVLRCLRRRSILSNELVIRVYLVVAWLISFSGLLTW